MKKLVVFLIAVIALASCSTTKSSKVITPAGTWDYSITGTPEGDFFGAMIITAQDKLYSAKMNAQGSEIAIDKFTWDATTQKVGGTFNYSGYPVIFEATLAGEELTGTMAVEDSAFPFKATRKK
jgi:hypothetical protein